ncbi:uL15m family ribosomal protein [Methermicoccus shengliensis]|uniref:Large ribosomal subunit protein uL15 n=1 Tax=Methermicoccus shengliensis TaxID=660064 RepID=A0A832VZ98_9EURY|nr:uL15m family ribosomal protein [Methermicoccus shengliensis]KUK05097.1 MAG: 50S ribosomal protein L15P [Euryarchaeota archaeon 55_53]KUK30390.1 MAG: 50S ribosomal protein L15P [Methanosarcinales archeaon 56_1174]MDI3488413.1 large subunit ribosomal protein [Methanosarcinales archaeon]MDN5294668.1 large subunit ribosomal protein [Methanosarcinales archaeon]HIH69379.1 50S ribosomal protein L15 [Methermicoccus shengliensis]
MQIKKFRGTRTCGGGTHKNRRGAGNRGGRGGAGDNKHHFVKNLLAGMRRGKHGFKRPMAVSRPTHTINVGELEQLVHALMATGAPSHVVNTEEEPVRVNVGSLGFDKVLGSGRMSTPMVVVAREFSASAIEKIEAAGGRAVFEE